MTLFKSVYLDHRLSLSPTELHDAAADMDAFLVKKIRRAIEGQCCTHGYVRPGSTQILARSMGQAEHCRFTGDFIYHCKIRVLCLLPEAGQMVDARILKVNKLGAYALIVDDGQIQEAMRILIPRDLHLGNEEFDALEADQGIKVRILQSRFQANDAFIQAVGTYEGPSAAATAAVTYKEKKELLKAAVADTEKAVSAAREALAAFSADQSALAVEAAKKALAEVAASKAAAPSANAAVEAARKALAELSAKPTPASNADAVAAARAALAAFGGAEAPALARITEASDEGTGEEGTGEEGTTEETTGEETTAEESTE